jgi:hypothetical protein
MNWPLPEQNNAKGGAFLFKTTGLATGGKDSPGTKIAGLIGDWALPAWFERQNEPEGLCFAPSGAGFFNRACRRWMELRSGNDAIIRVDRFGLIELPGPGWSLETWIAHGERLITPRDYRPIVQSNLPDRPGIETIAYFEGGHYRMTVSPGPGPSQFQAETAVKVDGWPLTPICLYFVLRPYHSDGFNPIERLEYRDGSLRVNGRRLIDFPDPPRHCYCSDAAGGDVARYLREGAGSSRIDSATGSGTCLIGYSGLAADLRQIQMLIRPVAFQWGIPARPGQRHRETGDRIRKESLPSVVTGKEVDQCYRAALNWMEAISGANSETLSHSAILSLIVHGRFETAGALLERALRRWRWAGAAPRIDEPVVKLPFLLNEYLRYSDDYQLIERYWGAIQKMGTGLSWRWASEFGRAVRDPKDPVPSYENIFWVYAAIKSVSELAEALGKTGEAEAFRLDARQLWSETRERLDRYGLGRTERIIPHDPTGAPGSIIGNLAAVYPLRLWERGEAMVHATLQRVLNRNLYLNGYFDPWDGPGLQPAATALLAQAMVGEGLDCTGPLEFLINSGRGAWTWPDRLHPRSGQGIGTTGHDPEATWQTLLLLRTIFIGEEPDTLRLLPGVFRGSRYWEPLDIDLANLRTRFGKVRIRCVRIGDIIQIELIADFRNRPSRILIEPGPEYRIIHVQAGIWNYEGGVISLDPDFQIVRFRRMT